MTTIAPINTQQLEATHPERSCWVMASAGTGKTKMLIDRLLRLLLLGTDPRRILCITYTKAAANEMKERLQTVLNSWSHMNEIELTHALTALAQEIPSFDKIEKARHLFKLLLERPLMPQTIHSFCQKILTQFPFEAGINPDFSVMDEANALHLREKCIRSTLYNPYCKKDFLFLIHHMSEFHLKECINEALSNRFKIVSNASKHRLGYFEKTFPIHSLATPDANGLIDLSLQELEKISILSNLMALLGPKNLQSKAKAVFDYSLQIMHRNHDPLYQRRVENINLSETTSFYLRHASHEIDKESTNQECEQALFELFLTQDGQCREKASTKNLLKEYPSFQEEFKDISLIIESLFLRREIEKTLKINEVFDHLYNVTKEKYNVEKNRLNTFDFDDLLEKTQLLLKNHYPWVMHKLDGGFDHILIDEAQDTSPYQWTILKELTTHFFEDIAQTQTPRTLFVVGDTKQSIYSFQGADPFIYKNIKMYFERLLKETGYILYTYYLDTCYRCAPAILTLVNQWCSNEKKQKHLLIDTASHHKSHRTYDHGKVYIWPLINIKNSDTKNVSQETKDINPNSPKPWQLLSTPILKESPEDELALMIAGRIHNLLHSKNILLSTGHPPKPEDIYILLRRRGTFMTKMSKALTSYHIPHTCQHQNAFLEHLYVKDFLAFLTFLDCPYDDLNLACLLKSPFLGVSENDLMRLCCNRTEPLWKSLSKDPKLKDHHHFLVYFKNLMTQKTLYTLCHHFLHLTYERSSTFFKQNLDTYFSSLLQLILNSQEKGKISPYEARVFIEKNAPHLKQKNNHGIQLMTIHGSKGLEAPIVILGDAGDEMTSTSANILFHDNFHILRQSSKILKGLKESEQGNIKAESDRLLYVALTRAQEELYITGIHQNKKESWYEDLLSFVEEDKEKNTSHFIRSSQNNDEKIEYTNKNSHIKSSLIEHYNSYFSTQQCKNFLLDREKPKKNNIHLHNFSYTNGNTHSLASQKGIQIHKIFELLGTLYNSDIKNKTSDIEKIFSSLSLYKKSAKEKSMHFAFEGLSSDQIMRIIALYKKYIQPLSEHFKLFFELSFVSKHHQMYRFDCVAIASSCIIIIDVKTGKRTTELYEKHKKQIEHYANILKNVYPERAIEGLLLYVHDQKALRWQCKEEVKNKIG